MDGELKEKIAKYADTAYAAAHHNSLLQTRQRITATTNQLAARGVILSGATIVEIAKIQGEHINTLVQAKADALLDAYELYGSEIDGSILIEANELRWRLIDAISANHASAGLPPGIPAFEMFKQQLVTNTGAIINTITCQIERRKLMPRVKKKESLPSTSAVPSTVDDDQRFAQMAIDEAKKSVPEDGRPHPKVGAVIVKDGIVVSKAHRGENPKSHAEYIALEDKLPDDLVAGATVYTTLEPCTTRNHPKILCAKRLVERKVARVVIGMLDPNPDIRGLGEQLLGEAGIETQLFQRDLKAQVEEMNREFIRAQKQKQKQTTPSSIVRTRASELSTIPLRQTLAGDLGDLARSGQPVIVSPAIPTSKSRFDTYVIFKIHARTVTLKNEGSGAFCDVPLDRLDIIWRGNDEKPELNLAGRLQWLTLPRMWKFFSQRPESQLEKEFGFAKPTTASDPIVIQICDALKNRGYELARLIPHDMRARINRGWELVYDDDGSYFEYPGQRILAAFTGR